MSKTKKTFWPYGIALFLMFMVCMIILSVYIALGASPEDDNAYFSTRQEVDKNINDILSEQKSLEDSYNFFIVENGESRTLETHATRKSEPIYFDVDLKKALSFKITSKDSKELSDERATARVYITRFATSKDDIDLGELKSDKSVFNSEPFALKQGFWKALININIEGKNAYFEQLIVAR